MFSSNESPHQNMSVYDESLKNICAFIGQTPGNDVEVSKLSNVDILIALSKFESQDNASTKDDELCMYCGSSQSPLQDQQEWIECESCKRWIHQACDYIFNPERCQQIVYICPCCRYVKGLPHPCNGDEQLGIDPRYAPPENKKQKKQKKKHESETEDETVQSHVSKRVIQPELPPVPKIEAPQFTQQELLQLNGRIEEKQPEMARRKNQGVDQSSQLSNFIGQAFSHTRVPLSRTFKNLQNQCKEAQPFKDINISQDDVSFCTFLALFYRQQIEQTQPDPFMNNSQGKPQNLEKEKRVAAQTQQQLQKINAQVNARDYLQQLLPVLPMDGDLRARAALGVFDSVLEAVERQRFRFIKTLIPQAVESCYLYQNGSDMGPGYFLQKSQQVLKQLDYPDLDFSYKSYLEPELLLGQQFLTGAPDFISPRQWLDLSSRGVQAFQGLGLVRASFLHAIVNVSLGLNVFDKPLGESVTDHIIHFGTVSARRFFERQIASQQSQIEAGCLYQIQEKCEHENCDCGLQNGVIGTSEMLQGDQKIADWDILETPTSVVWAIKMVGLILQECGKI